MAVILYATHRLIDSVWTVAYTVDGDRATIRGYGRHCNYGYGNERRIDRCKLIERDGRVVTKLVVQPYQPFNYGASSAAPDSTTYTVANPQNVFSYGDPPEPESEAS